MSRNGSSEDGIDSDSWECVPQIWRGDETMGDDGEGCQLGVRLLRALYSGRFERIEGEDCIIFPGAMALDWCFSTIDR